MFLFTRYYEIGSELLTSVQRTEESLLKLKSYRKSLTPSNTGAGGGMTDDNKIRLQLALDIEQFTLQVSVFDIIQGRKTSDKLGHSKREQTSKQRPELPFAYMHTLYKITSKRGQPLYTKDT